MKEYHLVVKMVAMLVVRMVLVLVVMKADQMVDIKFEMKEL